MFHAKFGSRDRLSTLKEVEEHQAYTRWGDIQSTSDHEALHEQEERFRLAGLSPVAAKLRAHFFSESHTKSPQRSVAVSFSSVFRSLEQFSNDDLILDLGTSVATCEPSLQDRKSPLSRHCSSPGDCSSPADCSSVSFIVSVGTETRTTLFGHTRDMPYLGRLGVAFIMSYPPMLSIVLITTGKHNPLQMWRLANIEFHLEERDCNEAQFYKRLTVALVAVFASFGHLVTKCIFLAMSHKPQSCILAAVQVTINLVYVIEVMFVIFHHTSVCSMIDVHRPTLVSWGLGH